MLCVYSAACTPIANSQGPITCTGPTDSRAGVGFSCNTGYYRVQGPISDACKRMLVNVLGNTGCCSKILPVKLGSPTTKSLLCCLTVYSAPSNANGIQHIAACIPGLANPALATCGFDGSNPIVTDTTYTCNAQYMKVPAPVYCSSTSPSLPPTQPAQNVTDPTQNYTIPAPTGLNVTGPVNTTAGIFKNDSGVLVPLLPGLQPGDVLTPEQLKNLTSDPNNQPLVVVYNVSNSNGSDTSVAPLTITNPPLSPALDPLPLTIKKPADNASGANMTGYVPADIANYTGMVKCNGLAGRLANVYAAPFLHFSVNLRCPYPISTATNAADGPFTVWVKYGNDTTWVPVTDPKSLPVGNTTATYMVMDKDGNRTTVGPTTIVVLPTLVEPPVVTPGDAFVVPPGPARSGSSSPIGNTTTTAVVFRNDSGLLVPVAGPFPANDTLTPSDLRNVTTVPGTYVIVYSTTNGTATITTSQPLIVADVPLRNLMLTAPDILNVEPLNATGAFVNNNPYANLTGNSADQSVYVCSNTFEYSRSVFYHNVPESLVECPRVYKY